MRSGRLGTVLVPQEGLVLKLLKSIFNLNLKLIEFELSAHCYPHTTKLLAMVAVLRNFLIDN
jgi:hypothetical protein